MKLLLSESFSTLKRMQTFGIDAIVSPDGDFWLAGRKVAIHEDINVALIRERATRNDLHFVRWQAETYAMPPIDQLESTWVVVQEILTDYPAIKQQFGGAYETGFVWGQAPGATGVVARERVFVGSGGLVPEFYCLCRAHGLTVSEAFGESLKSALLGGVSALPRAKEKLHDC